VAGGQGFEPQLLDPESSVLPIKLSPSVSAQRSCILAQRGMGDKFWERFSVDQSSANMQPIYACIVDKVAEFKGIVHAVHGMSDHVHLVATVPPTVAISRFIGQVKGSSSHLASRLREGKIQ
jgi:hypothetical protein